MANSTVDGSVVIDVDMNVSDAEKELARLKRKVFKLEDEIEGKESRRNDLVQRRRAREAEINELQRNRKILEGDAFSDTTKVDEKISNIRKEVSAINKEIGILDSSLDNLNSQLYYTKTRFGEVAEIADGFTKEFDTSTISGKLEKASYELAQVSAKGKGLGDKEYDKAYKKLALLTKEARDYQKELAKKPEQLQKEEEAARKAAEREEERAKKADEKRQKEEEAARAAQEAEQRLLDIKEKAVVSDQHIVNLNQELVRLKERQAELQRAGAGSGYKEYDNISMRLSEINKEVREYQNGLIKVDDRTKDVSSSTRAADNAMNRLLNRIKGLAIQAFVFTMITKALRAVRDLTIKYIKTNDEAQKAIAQLKGALLTLAQPLIEVIIPVVTLFVEILTKIIGFISTFVSALFGKTLEQSKDGAKAMYEEANAISTVGEAADAASKSLAGFDEINKIGSENAGYSGGASGFGDEIKPDFGFAPGKFKDIIDELMVYLSGALLVIGAILVFSGANIPLGLGLMVLGAAILAHEIKENWGAVDGKVRDAVNRMLIILGSALLVIGAILAFSGANIPLGIGLMILGAAMLATAVALNWGSMDEQLRTALTAALVIVGAFLIVLGAILTFSGGDAPLGIAMMALGAAALVTAVALNWDSMTQELQTALTVLMLIVGGALLVIGSILAFSGANVPLGIALMAMGAAVLATAVALNWSSMSKELQSSITALMLIIGVATLVLGAILAFSGANIPVGVALMALGAATLAAAVTLNWNSMDKELRASLTALMLIISAFLLVIGSILAFSGANIPLGIAMIVLGAAALATVAALNWDSLGSELRSSLSAIMLIVGEFLLVLGLLLTFSGANIPLGIGLIIVGAVSLATAAALDWDNVKGKIKTILSEVLAVVSAALLVLGALLTFSGTNIPLGLALLAAGALSLTAAAALNWDEVKGKITEIITALSGILGVAFLVLGAILTFSGANIPLGIALLVLGLAGVGAASLNWSAIEQALQGPIGRVTAIASAALLALGVILCFSGVGLPLGIALIAAGAVGLVTVSALNWNALKEKLIETWGGIKNWWNSDVSKYLSLEWWKNKGRGIVDGLKEGIKSAWDSFTNWFSDKWDNLFGSRTVSTGGGYSYRSYNSYRTVSRSIPELESYNIPALAKGAVIPPNREFMAVLGDQKSGTNIEAPATLIRQMVAEGIRAAGGAGSGVRDINITLEVDRQVFARAVYRANRDESQRVGVNFAGG